MDKCMDKCMTLGHVRVITSSQHVITGETGSVRCRLGSATGPAMGPLSIVNPTTTVFNPKLTLNQRRMSTGASSLTNSGGDKDGDGDGDGDAEGVNPNPDFTLDSDNDAVGDHRESKNDKKTTSHVLPPPHKKKKKKKTKKKPTTESIMDVIVPPPSGKKKAARLSHSQEASAGTSPSRTQTPDNKPKASGRQQAASVLAALRPLLKKSDLNKVRNAMNRCATASSSSDSRSPLLPPSRDDVAAVKERFLNDLGRIRTGSKGQRARTLEDKALLRSVFERELGIVRRLRKEGGDEDPDEDRYTVEEVNR